VMRIVLSLYADDSAMYSSIKTIIKNIQASSPERNSKMRRKKENSFKPSKKHNGTLHQPPPQNSWKFKTL